MFTGIVEEVGTVVELVERGDAVQLRVAGDVVTEGTSTGESIAVNGACLTVTELPGDGSFVADVMQETLDRTGLGRLTAGDKVNLERALRADGRFGGHVVQGHVDVTGRVLERRPSEHWDVVRIALPASTAPFVVEKGAITVDGVSLTVSALDVGWFEVSLIPATLQGTTLGSVPVGAVLNLEVDVLAKYVQRLLTTADGAAGATEDDGVRP